MWFRKRPKLIKGNGVEYKVRAGKFKGSEYNLVFDTREQARHYKKSLRDSKQEIQARIFKVEYINGFIQETEVW